MRESEQGLHAPDQDLWQLWRQGQRPDVHAFLASAGILSPAQVAAVLAVDQRERWQSGERIPAEIYLQLYPLLQEDGEKALELVYGEFLLREELGETPAPEEYLARFPQHANRFRQQLELHRALASSRLNQSAGLAGEPETIDSPSPPGNAADSVGPAPDTPTIRPDQISPVAPSSPREMAESTQAERPRAFTPPVMAGPGGRYTLNRLHARGGLGQVWLARDSTLDREVALKELRPDCVDYPPLRARFLEEAKITGQLEHPGIVPVYEVAQRPDNQRPFYTMRFINGRTLSEATQSYHQQRQRGQAGTLEQVNLLNAFVAVCNAVAYANARGVIHRDLKGRNVVLGDFGEVIVLDWGLAKIRGDGTTKEGEPGATGPESTRGARQETNASRETTASGQVLGTPGYMAPEQAAGRQNEIDPRTDVYGLGALLYEILTAQPPFTGNTLEQIQWNVMNQPPIPPRAVVASTPRALEAICLKALAKKPADRYPSAGELAKEMQRYLADEPVLAHREPVLARLRRWTRRHRTLVTGMAALLLTAVAALAIGLVLLGRKEQEAVAARNRAQANFQLARDAVEQYFVKITDNPRLKEAGLRGLRRELLEEAGQFYSRFIQERGQEPGLEYELGRAHVYLAMVREEMGALREAIDQVQSGRDILQKLVDRSPEEATYRNQLALASNRLGHMLQKNGKLAEAQEAYTQAHFLYQRLMEEFPQELDYLLGLAKVLFYEGWLAQTRRQPTEAEQRYLQAIALQTPLLDTYPKRPKLIQSLAQVQGDLSTLYLTQFQGRQSEAEQTLRASFRLHHQLVDSDPQNPDYQIELALCHQNLGVLYARLHRFAEAETAFQAARKLSEPLANRHPDAPRYQVHLVQILANLGSLYSEKNERASAAEYEERALNLQKQLVVAWPHVPDYQAKLALLHSDRAVSYRERGQWDKAEQEYLEAVQRFEHLAEAHQEAWDYSLSLAEIYGDLGDLHLKTGKAPAALEWYGKGAARLESIHRQLPQDERARYQLIRMYDGVARSLTRLGRYEEALKSWDRAIPLAAPGPSQGDLRVGRALTAARMHQHRQATEVAESELKQDSSAWTAYSAARVFAVASALPDLDREQAERYAARAVALLRSAVEKGDEHPEDMKTETDFESLRERGDFKQLLGEVEQKARGNRK